MKIEIEEILRNNIDELKKICIESGHNIPSFYKWSPIYKYIFKKLSEIELKIEEIKKGDTKMSEKINDGDMTTPVFCYECKHCFDDHDSVQWSCEATEKLHPLKRGLKRYEKCWYKNRDNNCFDFKAREEI